MRTLTISKGGLEHIRQRAKLFLRSNFYLTIALMIIAIVIFGFSFTVDQRFLHPTVPRPISLYVHAAVFSGWLILFVVQSLLVRMRRPRAHRYIGWLGAGYAVLLVYSGIETALEMARFNTDILGHEFERFILIISLWDMVVFATTISLALYWRRKPAIHRRLMMIALCEFTPAAFGRMPPEQMTLLFYPCMDTLILLAMVRDLFVEGRIHRVYLWALPLLVTGQLTVMYVVMTHPPLWGTAANVLL